MRIERVEYQTVWTGALWRESYAPKPAPSMAMVLKPTPHMQKSRERLHVAAGYFRQAHTAIDLAKAMRWKEDLARRICVKLVRQGVIERVGYVERVGAHGTPLTIYRVTQ